MLAHGSFAALCILAGLAVSALAKPWCTCVGYTPTIARIDAVYTTTRATAEECMLAIQNDKYYNNTSFDPQIRIGDEDNFYIWRVKYKRDGTIKFGDDGSGIVTDVVNGSPGTCGSYGIDPATTNGICSDINIGESDPEPTRRARRQHLEQERLEKAANDAGIY